MCDSDNDVNIVDCVPDEKKLVLKVSMHYHCSVSKFMNCVAVCNCLAFNCTMHVQCI